MGINKMSEPEIIAALDKLALLKLVFSGQFQTEQSPRKTLVMDNNQVNTAWKTIDEAETSLRQMFSTVSKLNKKLNKIKTLAETFDALEKMPGDFRCNVWKELKKEVGLEVKDVCKDDFNSKLLTSQKRIHA